MICDIVSVPYNTISVFQRCQPFILFRYGAFFFILLYQLASHANNSLHSETVSEIGSV